MSARNTTVSEIEVLPRHPVPSLRTELRASQRGRLICAITDAVAEQGYAATSVTDVTERAGVSRKAFYEHFEDKEACFLAAYDTGAKAIFEAMAEAGSGLTEWRETLDAVLSTWLAFLDADLAFTRAHMIEFWAAGEAARERWKQRRDRTTALLQLLHDRAREQDDRVVAVSPTTVAAVVGGVNRVVISHLLANEEAPLASLKPELLDFIELTLVARARP
jgi:AcrR family transcriptional regulator